MKLFFYRLVQALLDMLVICLTITVTGKLMKTYKQVRILMICLYMGKQLRVFKSEEVIDRENGHFGHKNKNGFYHRVAW